MKIYRLIQKLQEFRKSPEKDVIERLLTILAQYFFPHISYSSVNSWLDNIVQEVLNRLKIKHSAHSIFSVPLEKFSFWRDNHIDDNFCDETEARQIMHIMKELLFSEFECELQLEKFLLTLDIKEYRPHYVSYCK